MFELPRTFLELDERPLIQLARHLKQRIPAELTTMAHQLGWDRSLVAREEAHLLCIWIKNLVERHGQFGLELIIVDDPEAERSYQNLGFDSLENARAKIALLEDAWNGLVTITFGYPAEGKLLVKFYATQIDN